MTTIDSGSVTTRTAAVSLAVAPAVLAVSLVSHPFLSGRLPNKTEVAEAVLAGTNRWAVVHILVAAASALIAVALVGVRDHLKEVGDRPLSAYCVPFVVIGSTLFAVLPGMEFAALAAAETGASTAEIAEVQDSIQSWFTLVLVVSSVTFAIGVIMLATAIRSARIGGDTVSLVVAAALIVMAMSRMVPLSVTQFYVQSLAALLAMWPLAYFLWTRPPSEEPVAAQVA